MNAQSSVGVRPLAHPSHPLTGAEPGPTVAGFPEIAADWPGFCLSHLHCVGFRRDLIEAPRNVGAYPSASADAGSEARPLVTLEGELEIAYLHEELGHFQLAGSPQAQLLRLTLLELWAAMGALLAGREQVIVNGRTVSRKRTEPVVVPLDRAPANQRLLVYQLAHRAGELVAGTALVEEIFAVWASLRVAEQSGWFPAAPERTSREQAYAWTYEHAWGIRHFARVYEDFKALAEVAGFDAAYLLAFSALAAREPSAAFERMIAAALALARRGERVADPDLLLERVGRPLAAEHGADEVRALVRRKARRWSRDALLRDYWRVRPEEPLTWVFDRGGMEFYRSVAIWGERPVHRLILLESLRQQLTRGVGVRCPFWDGEACCGERALVEGLWRCTRHAAGEHGDWQPQGCLTAGAGRVAATPRPDAGATPDDHEAPAPGPRR